VASLRPLRQARRVSGKFGYRSWQVEKGLQMSHEMYVVAKAARGLDEIAKGNLARTARRANARWAEKHGARHVAVPSNSRELVHVPGGGRTSEGVASIRSSSQIQAPSGKLVYSVRTKKPKRMIENPVSSVASNPNRPSALGSFMDNPMVRGSNWAAAHPYQVGGAAAGGLTLAGGGLAYGASRPRQRSA